MWVKQFIRSIFANCITLLALLSPCCLFGNASAQGLIKTIPRNQPPVAMVFPPAPAEQMPSGTGKFVIFTREPTGKTNEWDFVAGAWECIPSRPNIPVTKRVEFCHSSWYAEPLVDGLVRDGSSGLFPRFVRLQVDADNYNSKVNLYDINYRTWDVRCLWQGERLRSFGAVKNSVFCQDSYHWFRLDAATRTISNDVPFIPLDVDGGFWLVRKTGEPSGIWSYDVAKEQFVGHFGDVDEGKLAHDGSLLSADGRGRSRILVPMPKDWRGDAVAGTLVLQHDGQTEDVRAHVLMRATPVRGTRLFRPIGTRLVFTKDGTVEFSANLQTNDLRERVWSIDSVSGKITKSFRPYVAPNDETNELFNGVPAPDYLQPFLKHFRYIGRSAMAPAFLMYLGILKKSSEYPNCTAGVSRDGRHILYKTKDGPLKDVFIYGDLRTKHTVRWVSPDKMKVGDCMEFVWVETP